MVILNDNDPLPFYVGVVIYERQDRYFSYLCVRPRRGDALKRVRFDPSHDGVTDVTCDSRCGKSGAE